MCVRSQLEAVSNVRTLMTGIPRAIREHRYLVMLKCYIDDSGSDIQEHGVFVLAGYTDGRDPLGGFRRAMVRTA